MNYFEILNDRRKYKETQIEKMERLLSNAVSSKFLTIDDCRNYRKGVEDCIKIMRDELGI